LIPDDYILAIGDNEPFEPYSTPEVSEITDCVSVFFPMDLIGQ